MQDGSESGGEEREGKYVEYDADFIDDTEVFDYYGGDRRKAKHSGFFINKVQTSAHPQNVGPACSFLEEPP